MREGWTNTTLGDIASFEYGKPLKAENRDGVGFPVFGSAGEVGRHSEPLISNAPVIVVGRKGTAGAVWWSDLPCSVIDTAYFVVPKISLDFKYLFQLLGFLDLPSLTAQTGVPGLNRDRAYSSEVNLPPIVEQKRIVDVVSSVDAYIDALQQHVAAARTARNAVLHELLTTSGDGWTETTLGDVAEVNMGQSPPGHTYNTEGVGMPFMQGSAEFGEHFPEPVKFCSAPAKIAEVGDLLLSVRAPVGDTNFANQRIAIGRGLATVRASAVSLTEFLRLIIQLNTAGLLATSGTGMFSSITGKNLKEFMILVPPIAEQKRIVEIVSSMDDVIQAAERAVVEAKNLRSGLLSDLLSGEHEIPVSYDAFLEAA
jgi:type I restriction enzyme S subunit